MTNGKFSFDNKIIPNILNLKLFGNSTNTLVSAKRHPLPSLFCLQQMSKWLDLF